MKRYLTSLLFASLLLFVHPHLARATAYDADGNPIHADSNDPDMTDDEDNAADNDQDDNMEESAPHKPPMRLPADVPHNQVEPKIVPAPEMATTPPQPPPETPETPAEAASPPSPLPQSEEPAPASAKGNWWHPHPGIKWQIQYAGKIDPSAKVKAFDLDLVDTDPAIIQQLKARGVKVICYFSAGSYEGWRPDAKAFPASVLGKPNGWKDEKWLDIRQIGVLRPIMKARIDLAKQKGCDAVDPDNVEGYDNNSGFPLKAHDQIVYNKMIAELAHADGLAVSLKNDTSQVEELLPYFDFQVNEQCFQYKSCEDIEPFIKAGKPVLNIEYKESPGQFCPQANKMNFDSVKKDLDLDAKTEYCR